jgi:hypothetical protein
VTRRSIVLFAVLACAGKDEKAPPTSTPRDAAIALAIDALAIAAPDCGALVGKLLGEVRSAYVAKDHVTNERAALQLWPAVPEQCRNGRWFLAAALLLDLGGNAPLEAGDVKLMNGEQALEAALLRPADLVVLQRVAMLSAIGRVPKLPADACERARSIGDGGERERFDDIAYICARAAIAAGDGKAAIREIRSFKFGGAFVDLDLLRAHAAKAAGDTKAVKRHAKAFVQAVDRQRAQNNFIASELYDAMLATAKLLAK